MTLWEEYWTGVILGCSVVVSAVLMALVIRGPVPDAPPAPTVVQQP